MATRVTSADARSRGLRTGVQGLISVALVALSAFTLDTVTPGETIEWGAYAMGGATALGTAVAAYVHRLLDGDKPRGAHAADGSR